MIEYDLEANPLQIKTDSAIGDGDWVDVAFYTAAETSLRSYFAFVMIHFSSPMEYRIGNDQSCGGAGYTEFPTAPPTEQDKVWTITLSSTSIKIDCNDVEVIDFVFSDYGDDCTNTWADDVEQIAFYTNGIASDEYRQQPSGSNNLNLR
jgi:hypothetical protein